MTISREAVDHVAELAKLGLTEAERELFAGQLGRILGYIDELRTLEAGASEPVLSIGPGGLRLRDDRVTPSMPRDLVLANAPSAEAGQFRVPPILD